MKIASDGKSKEKGALEELADGSVEAEPIGMPSEFHFGVPQKKMSVYGEIPGWHMCFIYEDELHTAYLDGYQHVVKGEVKTAASVVPRDSDLGENISMVVNKPAFDGGMVIRQFLMKIRNEWYEAASASIEKRNKQIDQGIMNPSLKKGFYQNPSIPNSYNPIPE